jgi:hypothetical protein
MKRLTTLLILFLLLSGILFVERIDVAPDTLLPTPTSRFSLQLVLSALR